MSKRFAGFLVLALVVVLVAPAAMAQATRTWVSGTGDDVNPCSRTAPCKTYAGAISKTAAHGTISTLDPGGFGAVTITKSITIEGTGTNGSILAALTNGIIVNAAATDKIILRDLSINGANSGINGIRYLSAAQVTVENVNITGFNSSVNSRAVDVQVGANAELIMRNVTITHCQNGVRLNSTAGQLLATLENVAITNMQLIGVEAAAGQSLVTISNSNISNNNSDGVKVSGASAIANIFNSTLAFNNGAGVNVSIIGGSARLHDTRIINNNVGVTFVGGANAMISTGKNVLDRNGSSAVPNAVLNED
jgi:hypothetical protein